MENIDLTLTFVSIYFFRSLYLALISADTSNSEMGKQQSQIERQAQS